MDIEKFNSLLASGKIDLEQVPLEWHDRPVKIRGSFEKQIDWKELAGLYGPPAEVVIDLPGPAVQYPDDRTTTIIDIGPVSGHISNRDLFKMLRDVAAPVIDIAGERASGGYSGAKIFLSALSIFDVLKQLKSRLLTRDELAICRAILLVMQSKENRILREKGADLTEIAEALEVQQETIENLQEQIDRLLERKVIKPEIEGRSGSGTFYVIVR